MMDGGGFHHGRAARIRRHRRRTAAVVLVLQLAAAGAARGAGCVGDCDGDGAVAIDELVRGVSIALARTPLSACTAVDGNADGAVTIDELIAAVSHALDGCPAQRSAFVIATDFQTGSFATVSLDEPRLVEPVRPQRRVNGDAVARAFGGLVYVVNRFLADNIQVLDPSRDFATTSQCSTGAGSNPQDIAFVGATKAYVTRYDQTALLVANPSAGPDCAGFAVGSIDLSAFADADGIPEMTQMAVVGRRLYVAVQRLDRDNFFVPADRGGIVVIDTATDQVEGEIALTGRNPFAATKGLAVQGGAIVVGEAGAFGVHDGGIERVDLGSGSAQGFFITEAALGGDVTDFVLVSDRLGYAVISNPDFTNSVVAFDPSAGAVTDTLLAGVPSISDLELNDRGELFVADRTLTRPGIRIFRASDGLELTPAPLDLGLPPFEILFLR